VLSPLKVIAEIFLVMMNRFLDIKFLYMPTIGEDKSPRISHKASVSTERLEPFRAAACKVDSVPIKDTGILAPSPN